MVNKECMKSKPRKTEYLSVQEVALKLGISRIAVFKRIQKGQLPAQKIGRAYVIAVDDVAQLHDGGRNLVHTATNKKQLAAAVKKVVAEYGETLKLLGRE